MPVSRPLAAIAGTLAIAASLAVTAPAGAAIIYQASVTAEGGVAMLADDTTLPALISSGTIWIGVGPGSVLTSASWTIDGELQKLWWEPDGGFDADGNPIPVLTGNEYIYSPTCESSLASPVCDGEDLLTTLDDNLLRIDFARPPDSNDCPATYQGSIADCAFLYRIDSVTYALQAAGPGEVTFTFYDSSPTIVPEPGSWSLLVVGFGLTGALLRRRQRRLTPALPVR